MKSKTAPGGRFDGHRAAARAACLLALVLGIGGCAEGELHRLERGAHGASPAVSPATRHAREQEMNRQWQNRPLAELLVARGRPRIIMDIPGGGMPPSYALVYGHDPDSGCIDAFAVSSHGAPMVRIYHCR